MVFLNSISTLTNKQINLVYILTVSFKQIQCSILFPIQINFNKKKKKALRVNLVGLIQTKSNSKNSAFLYIMD